MGLIPWRLHPDLPRLRLCHCCKNYQIYPYVESQNSLFPFHIQSQEYSGLSPLFPQTSITVTIRPLQITVIIIRISKKNKFLFTIVPCNSVNLCSSKDSGHSITFEFRTQYSQQNKDNLNIIVKLFTFNSTETNNTETNNVEPNEGHTLWHLARIFSLQIWIRCLSSLP